MEDQGSTNPPPGDDAVDEPVDDLQALHAELFERSSTIVELDAGQIEAWVSGLFAAWDNDADALAFVQFCRQSGGPVGATLCTAIAELADEPVRASAAEGATELAAELPTTADAIGAARPVQAWEVRAAFGNSLVVGFAMGQDNDVDHCALAELDADSVLSDLQMAGRPDELLSEDTLDGADVELVSVEVGDALARLANGWRAAVDTGVEPGPGILGNQRLLRRRLASTAAEAVPLFVPAPARSVAELRNMSAAEIADADAAARSTLDAAVPPQSGGGGAATGADQAWIAVIQGSVTGLTPRERDGLLWLEWADWLGAGIGLLRAGRSAPITGETLVDHINACPEVSSTIPASDRDYAIWAFEIAIDHLEDRGLASDGQLTDRGIDSLRSSMVAAWTSAAR